MKFVDWYLKIAFGSALIGVSMEFFTIETGFYEEDNSTSRRSIEKYCKR